MVTRIIKRNGKRIKISFTPQKHFEEISRAGLKKFLTPELKIQKEQGIPAKIIKMKKPIGKHKFSLLVKSPILNTIKRVELSKKNKKR